MPLLGRLVDGGGELADGGVDAEISGAEDA